MEGEEGGGIMLKMALWKVEGEDVTGGEILYRNQKGIGERSYDLWVYISLLFSAVSPPFHLRPLSLTPSICQTNSPHLHPPITCQALSHPHLFFSFLLSVRRVMLQNIVCPIPPQMLPIPQCFTRSLCFAQATEISYSKTKHTANIIN